MTILRRLCLILLVLAQPTWADKYIMDTQGGHAFIQFKISHLGFSYILGRFERFNGEFEFDPKRPNEGRVELDIHISSLDTGHSERDKHLRDWDYFASKKFPRAYFRSTELSLSTDAKGKLSGTLLGELKLKGHTKPVELQIREVGRGKDPWGGERIGFEATTVLRVTDFGINFYQAGEPAEVEVYAVIEGIKR